jgi:hypothetical protein
MLKRAGRFVLAFMVLVPGTGEAALQDPSPITRRDTYWLGVGLGAGSEDFAAQANASYQFGANLISLRIASTAGLFDTELTDYGILYGRATRGPRDRHILAIAAGVALVDGCGGGGSGFLGGCRDQSTVIGLPLEVQASYRPGKLLGIGLYGFANLNRRRSFGGVALGLQVGRLR